MSQQGDQNPSLVTARRLLWVYCIAWVFEGAIRKWVLPQYSLELLMVRDPIALLIYYFAARARVFPSNGFLAFLWFIAVFVTLQGFMHAMAGDVLWGVAAFGIRTFFLHMPLIWVVSALFGRKEIVTLGRWVLILAPFFAALMVVQFEVGPDHWLNVGTLKGGGQIGSVEGRIRPPAVFSFITGPVHFYALTTVFTLGGVLTKKLYPSWLLACGAVSILMAMAVSGSRGLVMGCFLVAAAGMAGSFATGKRIGPMLAMGAGLLVAVVMLASFGVMKEGFAAFMERWSAAEETGTSGSKVMTQRVGGSFLSAFALAGQVPIAGQGVGATSNLATESKGFFIGVEGEWDRVIFEVGPITGFMFLGWRALLALRLFGGACGVLRTGNFLCLLFGMACLFDLVTGNIRQVTSYGFITVCAGLCLAAHRAFSEDEEAPIAEQVEDIMLEKPMARGRGRFAVGGSPARS